MRVLAIADAYDPRRGSDKGMGWGWVCGWSQPCAGWT